MENERNRKLNRRSFIQGIAAACVAAKCGDPMADAFSVKGIRIGVQMWSVHELWKKDPVGAFRRLKALGYDGVQSFGFYAMDWNELEKMLDGEGLCVVDMPFYMNTIMDGGFTKFVEFCKRFKVDFAFEPYAKYSTATEWLHHARELTAVAERFAANGIRAGYHNHQHELRQHFEGKTPLEFLYDAGLPFELDVGHVKLAGGDPVAWLRRLSGRVPSIHAKPSGADSVGGAGDANDWRAIFAGAAAAGTKWAIVECETRRNTFEDVEMSMKFLKGLQD